MPRPYPDGAESGPPMLDDLDVPPEVLFDPRLKIALFVSTIRLDETQPRKGPLKRLQKQLASLMILDVGGIQPCRCMIKPLVSTSRCLFRPFTCLPPS